MPMSERRRRGVSRAVMLLTAAWLCGSMGIADAAQPGKAPAPAPPATSKSQPDLEPNSNPYNEELLRMTPEARAAKLAGFLGAACIGTRPFLMGVTKTGRAKGYAYWSLECAGDKSYMIQLSPDGAGAAIDCATLKAAGKGRECFKTF